MMDTVVDAPLPDASVVHRIDRLGIYFVLDSWLIFFAPADVDHSGVVDFDFGIRHRTILR
jgi:hypothetical protein